MLAFSRDPMLAYLRQRLCFARYPSNFEREAPTKLSPALGFAQSRRRKGALITVRFSFKVESHILIL